MLCPLIKPFFPFLRKAFVIIRLFCYSTKPIHHGDKPPCCGLLESRNDSIRDAVFRWWGLGVTQKVIVLVVHSNKVVRFVLHNIVNNTNCFRSQFRFRSLSGAFLSRIVMVVAATFPSHRFWIKSNTMTYPSFR